MPPSSSLKVLGGPLDGRELIMQDEAGEVLIGEDPSCQLRLELPGLAPIHARVRRDAGGTTVYEAGSPGPIYVNDDLVQGRAPLRSGDIIWLGPPGEPQSVMIQCRLAPLSPDAPAAAAPAPPAAPVSPAPTLAPADLPAASPGEAADEAFFIADEPQSGPVGDEVHYIDDFVEAPAPAPANEEAFYFEEPPGTPPVALGSDDFFISDPEPSPPREHDAPAVASPPTPAGTGVGPKPAQPAAAAPPRAPEPPPPAAAANPVPARPQQEAASGSVAAKAEAGPGAARTAQPPAQPARGPAPAAVAPRARASGDARRPVPGAVPRRPAPPASRTARYAALAVAAVAALAGGGFFIARMLSAPTLETLSPQRAKVGQVVTLAGRHFAANPEGNRVLFGDRPVVPVTASATRIEVEVPELPTTAGRDVAVPVSVETGERRTGTLELAVYQSPRIHGLSPDVGMPGDELTLAGSGWGPGAEVHFGSRQAELLMTSATALRVRVPAVNEAPGTSLPVTVAIGGDRSNEAPFVIGRLPLVQAIAPTAVSPGDLVTLKGRGFHAEAHRNSVSIAGLPALVVGASGGELQVMVPFAPAGEVSLELRVPGSADAARVTLSVAAAADPVDWRFVAEPFLDAAGHPHASVSTALGPAFVLSAAGDRTAAERAAEATRHLNDAAAVLRSSLDADFRARGSAVQLVPRESAVLEATAEDAAAYGENWTGGRAGTVVPERLAEWWTAIARDLVLILLRNEAPRHAAGIGAEGRVLGEVFQAARRGGQYGLAQRVVAELKPAQRQALRVMAQRVPAALAGTAPGAQAAAGGGAGAAAPLRLQGRWTGFESAQGTQRLISVSFGRSGGTLTFTEGVSIGVPLLSAETPQRNAVRFSAQVRGGVRYYLGSWNGEKLSGRITSDPAGRNAVGTFELSPGL